jgi:hypothetical protein
MTEFDTRNQLYAFVGVVLTLLAIVIVILIPPARGFEPSLYQVFPWYFFALIGGAILVGFLPVYRTARGRAVDARTWMLGLVPVLVSNALLLFMPYIRGYPVYGRADVLTHVGFARNIATSGVVSNNIYPNTHLLVNALAYATGLDIATVINLIPPAISFVYIGAMYLLARVIFDDDSLFLLAVPFTILLIGGRAHLGPVPYGMSVFLVPFALYLFIKEQQTKAISCRIALIVALVSLIIYHPLTALFLMFVILVYILAKKSRRFSAEHIGPTNIGSLAFAVFATWYLNFAGIIFRLESVLNVLVGSTETTSTLDSYTATVSRTSPELIDLVRIAIFRYGKSMLLFTLAGLFILAIVLWYLNGVWSPTLNIYTAVFMICFTGFAVGSVLFLVNNLIVGWGRPLMFANIFSTLLAGGLFYVYYRRLSDRDSPLRSLDISYGVVMVLLVGLVVFSLYPSPLTTHMNVQVTDMELDGTDWLFEHRSENIQTEEFGLSQHRFYEVHNGEQPLPDGLRRHETRPPPHFNYTEHQTIGESYTSDTYLMITEYGRVTYQVKFPEYEQFWQYTPEDFSRLERDPTVSRMYDNGELDLYYIEGVRAERPSSAENTTDEITTRMKPNSG